MSYVNPNDLMLPSSSTTTPTSSVNTPYFSTNPATTPQTTASTPPTTQEKGKGVERAEDTTYFSTNNATTPPTTQEKGKGREIVEQTYRRTPTDYSVIQTAFIKDWLSRLSRTKPSSAHSNHVRGILHQQANIFIQSVRNRFNTAVTCPYCHKPPPSANPPPEPERADFSNETGGHNIPEDMQWEWACIWVEFDLFEELGGMGRDVDEWLGDMQGRMQRWEVRWWEEVLMVGEPGGCVQLARDVGVTERDMLHDWIAMMGE